MSRWSSTTHVWARKSRIRSVPGSNELDNSTCVSGFPASSNLKTICAQCAVDNSEPNTTVFEPTEPIAPLTADMFAAWSPALLGDCHASLQTLYRYWHARGRVRLMPGRSDIDP